MPIYKYKCLSCNTVFEEIILKENQLVACLNCQSENIAKLPSCFNSPSGANAKGARKSCGGGCSHCHGCS